MLINLCVCIILCNHKVHTITVPHLTVPIMEDVMYSQPAPLERSQTEQKQTKPPRSTLVSRNVTIGGHRTSVRLEPDMWSGLTDISRRERANMHEICTAVARQKDKNTSLTAAIRVFVMAYYRASSTEEGHTKAGHGYGVALMAANMSPNPRVPSSQTPNGAVTISMQGAQTLAQKPASSVAPYVMGMPRSSSGAR